jgi:protein tyrosine phosphatase (PTP) superfamily phosphohydrolase (DUF442 family)
MNRSFTRLLLGVAAATSAIQGCQHACRQPAPPPPVVSGPFAAPAPVSPFAAPPQSVAPAPIVPTPAPSATRSYEPPFATPTEPSWRVPSDSGLRLAPPDTGGARLQTPDFNPVSPSRSPAGEGSSPTPLLPAGIPQFAIAKDQVATGLKPMLDGVEWLRQNGYRAVLHVRQPGEDDSAERNLFEMRGLRYLSLELSPQTLSRSVVDEFNRMVNDRTNQPLFVYDKTGPLMGSLWYLHFRESERQSDAEARARASRLGLPETPNGLSQEMWLAIQKFLSEPAR